MAGQDADDVVVNVWNCSDVKNALDDAAIEYFKKQSGHQEEHLVSNSLLILGYLGCIFAGVSHLYPIPFPENTWLLIVCVISYMVLSSGMQLITSFVQKDRIISTSSKQGSWRAVSTSMEKYSDVYTVTVEEKKGGSSKRAELKKSYGAWFDTEGKLHMERFRQDLAGLLKKTKTK